MEEQISATTIILSVTTSLLASWLFFYYLRFREKNIKDKIEELESDEEFVIKLSKGNKKLLRSTFVAILISFLCLFISLAVFFVTNVIGVEGNIKNFFFGVSLVCVLIGAGLCFYQARSIIQSANLTDAKKEFQKKREALESKL